MAVILAEALQDVRATDVFLPLFGRSIGSCQINHEGFLVKLHAARHTVVLPQTETVVIPLEGFHVLEQEVAAEQIVEGYTVVGIALQQFVHDDIPIVVETKRIGTVRRFLKICLERRG